MQTRKIIATAAMAVAIVAAVAAVVAYYYRYNPVESYSPRCVVKYLTGYDCPGCGSQRALHALLNGDFSAAWHFNPYVFVSFPAAVYFIVVEAGRRRWPRLHRLSTSVPVIVAVFALTLGWWIGRNL